MLKPLFQTKFDTLVEWKKNRPDLYYNGTMTSTLCHLLKNPNCKATLQLLKTINIDFSDFDNDFCTNSISHMATDEAMEFLQEHPTLISWDLLCHNPHPIAIQLIKERLQTVTTFCDDFYFYMRELCLNPNEKAVELFKQHFPKPSWCFLSVNTSDLAMDTLRNNHKWINWSKLSGNPNPKAVQLLKDNRNKIDWEQMCRNTNDEALQMLIDYDMQTAAEDNVLLQNDKTGQRLLCLNPNPLAMKLLMHRPNYIHWDLLATNPNDVAVDIILAKFEAANVKARQTKQMFKHFMENQNPRAFEYVMEHAHMIDWDGVGMSLWSNSNIFEPEEEFIFK